jgi:hypothetical protein
MSDKINTMPGAAGCPQDDKDNQHKDLYNAHVLDVSYEGTQVNIREYPVIRPETI